MKAIEYTLKAERKEFDTKRIRCSADAADYARQFYFDDMLIYESTFIILLNGASRVIGYAKISQGGVDGAVVDLRIVAKYAIDSLAKGVVFLHNHPSGLCVPSKEDEVLTERMVEGLKLFRISLVDSIILTETDYYSFKDEGKI
jgi:DNA repair protein RadC